MFKVTVSKAIKLVGVLLVISSSWTQADVDKDQIKARIKPVGEVCVQGEGNCAQAAAPVASGPKSGEQVYNGVCTACHGAGVMGAPKVGDSAAWAPRAAQGIDTLVSHAVGGFNAMPPKGTCATCSDDEIKAAVEYMVKASK